MKDGSQSLLDLGVCICAILAFIFVIVISCSNPYVNPNTSKAISEEKQIELLQQQNKILERIAVALENKP